MSDPGKAEGEGGIENTRPGSEVDSHVNTRLDCDTEAVSRSPVNSKVQGVRISPPPR